MSDCMAGTAVVVELLLVLSASVLIMGGGGGGERQITKCNGKVSGTLAVDLR